MIHNLTPSITISSSYSSKPTRGDIYFLSFFIFFFRLLFLLYFRLLHSSHLFLHTSKISCHSHCRMAQTSPIQYHYCAMCFVLYSTIFSKEADEKRRNHENQSSEQVADGRRPVS